MGSTILLSEAGAAEGLNMATSSDVTNILDVVKTGVSGVLEISSSAFGFLMSNPLCAFMVTIGFAYTALGLVRRGLRIAKRT